MSDPRRPDPRQPDPRPPGRGTPGPRQVVHGGPEASLPAGVRRHLPPGEAAVLVLKPHPLFILLSPLRVLVLGVIAATVLGMVWSFAVLTPWAARGVLLVALIVTLRLVWAMLEWTFRWYVLTESTVLRVGGVLRRVASSVPRSAVRASGFDAPLLERVFGLGSVGFASAGTGGYEVVWAMIARPAEALNAARPAAAPAPPTPADTGPPGPAVIGLAGGIGSGKSTVAAAFARRGCIVSDSDRQTDVALARQDVRDTLSAWWGPGVLTPEGAVDRRAVARIVFADPEQRRRLEGLIHPLVRQSREALIAQAAAARAPAVIVDAPLLFEAGLDADCDAVVYVEAPRALRLERVRERGWDEAELDRREKAQWPLEQKRHRSDHVVVNAGHPEEIDRQVEGVLRAILSQRPGS